MINFKKLLHHLSWSRNTRDQLLKVGFGTFLASVTTFGGTIAFYHSLTVQLNKVV